MAKPSRRASSRRRRRIVRDQRRVVLLARARARHVRAVELLAQVAPAQVLQGGNERRLVEREPPRAVLRRGVRLARRARGLRRQVERARGQPRDLGGIAQHERERLGRVEHVVRERGLVLGELGRDRLEARQRRALEADPRELRVADQERDDALLRGVEPRVVGALLERDERVEDRLALGDPQPEAHDVGLDRLVRGAQRRRVPHPQQVAHDTPRCSQPVADPFERLDDSRPGRRGALLERRELARKLREQRANGGLDVLGLDRGRSAAARARRPSAAGSP